MINALCSHPAAKRASTRPATAVRWSNTEACGSCCSSVTICVFRSGAVAGAITTPFCAAPRGLRREVWRTLLRARAIENQCYAAGANRVGDDPAARYAGDSALVDFKGRTMAEAGGGERILTGVFDTEALAAFREKFPAWRDADEFVLK